jgi:hypothetical protein
MARVSGYAGNGLREQPGAEVPLGIALPNAGQTEEMSEAPEVVALELWTGPVGEADAHANFKREVAAGALVDPLPTLRNLAAFVGLPVGAVIRHALVKWTSAGSDALLEVGPGWVRRLTEPVARAEAAGSDAARLAAYEELRGLLGWLAAGLDQGPFDGQPDG